MIGCNHAACAGHILHDKVGVAGDVLAEITSVETDPLIMIVPGLIADDESDCFALVEIRLRKYLFKVQRVQKFNDGENQKAENLERLNL
jgi:hypothetical protein